jgi:hypothetical protein
MKKIKETKMLFSNLTKMLLSNLIEFYLTLDDLVTAINEFVDSQDYVVVKKRIKISKKEVLRKAILRCDKDEKHEYDRFEKRETFSRRCEYFFEVVDTLKNDD